MDKADPDDVPRGANDPHQMAYPNGILFPAQILSPRLTIETPARQGLAGVVVFGDRLPNDESVMNQGTRPLTVQERALLRWMLEHAGPEAAAFMPQVELAEATLWKCECGCASFNLRIRGNPEAPPGCHPVADFVFGDRETLSGVFVFEQGGILSGLEVYGLAGDAPKALPSPEELRPFVDESTPT